MHVHRLFALAVVAACVTLAVAAEPSSRQPMQLFNGKDLTGWYTYTVQTGYENPGIFTVADGMLKIAGGKGDTGYFGGIVTKQAYENYHLSLEYKWGEPTYGNRKDKARDSGILLALRRTQRAGAVDDQLRAADHRRGDGRFPGGQCHKEG